MVLIELISMKPISFAVAGASTTSTGFQEPPNKLRVTDCFDVLRPSYQALNSFACFVSMGGPFDPHLNPTSMPATVTEEGFPNSSVTLNPFAYGWISFSETRNTASSRVLKK